MLQRDEKVSVQEAKTIQLGNEEFFIAPLMLRQTMAISPLLPAIVKILNDRVKTAEAFRTSREGKAEDAPFSNDDAVQLVGKLTLSQADLDICLKAIRAGLSRAYPAVTEDDILDRNVTIQQIITAISIVISQTRLVEKSAGNDSVGEAKATA